MESLAFSDEFVQQLDVMRLSQVPRLRVHDTSLSTFDQILEHFLNGRPPRSAEGASKPSYPSLEIKWWSPEHPWDGCFLSFTELIPGGRRRDLEIVGSFWIPDVPKMASIVHRVTKLSVRINDWAELFEALGGASALEELVVRIYYISKLSYSSTPARCPKLVSFVLENGWENTWQFPIAVSVKDLTNFVERTIAPELLGTFRMQLRGFTVLRRDSVAARA